MTKKAAIIFSILCCSIFLHGTALIEDGKPLGRIYTPARIDRPVLLAVQELQEHLKAMTGAAVELAWRAPGRFDTGFVLEVRSESEWKGKESAQAFRIVETAKPARVTIRGNTALAVLYGVYQYLADQGVRWFEPGETGTNIPHLAKLEVKPRNVTSSPSFLYRCLDFSGWHDSVFDYSDREEYREKIHYEYDLWLLRNRLVFDRTIHRGDYFDFNRFLFPAGHGLRTRCKLNAKDIDKEPERFPLVTRDFKQERTARASQICFTNETNIRNAVESCLEHFSKLEQTRNRNTDLDEINDVVDMSLADCGGICECAECRKVGGDGPLWRDRLVWHFMNRVARELNEKMPAKKIMLFAPYFDLTKPPADVKIEPNIVAIACRSLAWLNTPEDAKSYPLVKSHRENVEATVKAGASMQSYDYFLWADTPQPLAVLAAAQFYARNGFKRYHAEVMQRNELVWPLLWTLAQFTWDSSQDPYRLLDEFCGQYYGPANGKLVLDILNGIDANSRTIHRIIYGGPADASYMLPDSSIREWRTRLAEARKNTKGVELERLNRFADSLEVQMRYVEVYRAYCKALNERTPAAIRAFRDHVEAFNRFWYENRMIRFCTPRTHQLVQIFAAVDFGKLVPQGRKLGPDVWMQELFAGTGAPDGLEVFRLPENWKFQFDVNGHGLEKNWNAVDFDDSKWPEISTWATFEEQGYAEVDGRFWYRTAVDVPKFKDGEKIILRIGSLDDDGEVYVNGKLVYRCTDAAMWDKSFAVDVSDVIKPGQRNVIAVRGYDATGGGGLWRPSAIYSQSK